MDRLAGQLRTTVVEPTRAAWTAELAAAAKTVADVAPDRLALQTTALQRALAAYGPQVDAPERAGAAGAVDAAACALATELAASVEGLVSAKAFKTDAEKAAIDRGRELLDRATIALSAWIGEFHRFDAAVGGSSPTPGAEPLYLRNATTTDPIQDPYTLHVALTAPAETGYFVLQHAVDALSEEEHRQLATDHKLAGSDAVELTDAEEDALLERLDRRIEALERELRRDDEEVFELLAPIPTHGWLIRSSKRLAQLAAIKDVRFVDVFHPAFKLSATLYERVEKLAVAGGSSDLSVGLRLLLFPGEAADAVVAEVQRLRGVARVADHIGFEDDRPITMKVVGAVVPEHAIAAVAQLRQVYLIDEDAVPGALLDIAHTRTGVDAARVTLGALPLAPALDGAGEVIGIYDSGVDNGALIVADLAGRVIGDTANWVNLPAGPSWADRWYDGVGPPAIAGHGTGVAGIAIGDGNLSNGAIVGVAPAAQAVIRPWSADFQPGWPTLTPMTFDINEALTNAHAAGARIHNDSWGETTGPNLNALTFFRDQYRHSDLQIDAFTRARPEMLVVTSAGNEGAHGASSITSPGTGKNVLTVGSSGNSNPANGNPNVAGTAPLQISASSSRGPVTPTGRLKPEVVAPGDKIATLHPQGVLAAPSDHQNHAEYRYGGGTSYAAPYVSGVAALIRQFLGDANFHGGNVAIGQRANPSGMLIKALIVNGAARINPAGNHIPNNREGWGLIDLDRSIDPARLLLVYDSLDPTDPLNGGNPFTLRRRGTTRRDFPITIVAGQPLSITLAYYDRTDGGAVGALVYDLDLVMRRNSNGDLYRGGAPGFAAGESRRLHTGALKINAALRDNINTVEKLYIANPAAGTYSVRVKRRRIPRTGLFQPAARVPFALVVRQD